MRAMQTSYMGTVTVIDEGETIVFEKAKVDTLGDTMKLYVRQPHDDNDLTKGFRYVAQDTLLGATVDERNPKRLDASGTSQHLVENVRLARDNAMVRWIIEPKGCSTC